MIFLCLCQITQSLETASEAASHNPDSRLVTGTLFNFMSLSQKSVTTSCLQKQGMYAALLACCLSSSMSLSSVTSVYCSRTVQDRRVALPLLT